MNAPPLHQLAERAGIALRYGDTWGTEHDVSDATLRALLGALRLAAETDADIEASLAQLQALERTAPQPTISLVPAWRPHALTGDGRRWGIAVQLYALRGAHTWGIGDFSALAELMHGAAALGACAVGINPLHALFPMRPEQASPYSPSSRRFLNPLYLDVEAIDDFATCEAVQKLVADAEFQSRLNRARDADCVRYTDVTALKYGALTTLYRHFHSTCLTYDTHPRTRAFRAFQCHEGRPLRRFATFHALAEARPDNVWQQWPSELQDPDSPAVATFVATHAEAIEFHEYLQWQAAVQLERVNEAARACGMSVGLYTDLAVGADASGAECWNGQQVLARGATIGAPPDAWNLFGQNWGLPPPDPLALARAAGAPLADLWQANMQRAGALRIDHILGLMRLYWIPAGANATAGAYVHYRGPDLLRLLAEQSRRARCLVIGEDLGTVPSGLREAMHEAGILAYRLLVFERHDGRFRAPHEYPADALVTTGTHDLPPLAMWWDGEDLALRAELDLWPNDDQYQQAIADRSETRRALTDALRDEGLHTGDAPDAAPIEAIYAFLSRTPCKLLMVQPEDVLGLHVQSNVPGTTDQHPNWRRRLPYPVDELLADPRMMRIATTLNDQGRADS